VQGKRFASRFDIRLSPPTFTIFDDHIRSKTIWLLLVSLVHVHCGSTGPGETKLCGMGCSNIDLDFVPAV